MTEKIRPLGSRIIARPLEPEELKTKAGLVLVKSEHPDDIQCEVMAIGRKVKEIKKGNLVLVPKTIFAEKAIRTLFIKEEHCLCILERETA